ncbi:hypothetical protein A6M21_05295 [Desulfotomaculum copahuensis]|uniref:Uncharacterized protein n=2 Tax=Desulfotomaculum copahuensis TaxID=1838280 RepID=A0A1B7LI03_9FIRM|nr:hypothetical protein A6M21_05295 [Desulfotomaculum copahuensis]
MILLFVLLSLQERVRLSMVREKPLDLAGSSRPSPFSEAVAGLVGTAGGIYLSLVLLTSFLEIQIPARIHLGGMQMEPLAAFSIALAVVQPFLIRFWQALHRA